MEIFEISSGKIRVTDPCYVKDTWCAGVLDNCLNGEWEGYINVVDNTDSWGKDRLVTEIMIVHKDYTIISEEWTKSDIHVGVDSGQAGFFDDEKYPEDPRDDEVEENFYYEIFRQEKGPEKVEIYYRDPEEIDRFINIVKEVSKTPISPEEEAEMRKMQAEEALHRYYYEYDQIANVGFGVCSISGYGDGGYNCYYQENSDGKKIAAKIVFVGYFEDE